MSKETLNTAEKVLNTRSKYLEAMACALGVEQGLARRKIDLLIKSHLSGALYSPEYKKERNEMDKEDVEWTEFIGKVFLTGSPQYEGLSFTVGSRIFSLLNEDPKSGYFKNLGEWVGMWTDGSGTEKFQKVLNGILMPITKEQHQLYVDFLQKKEALSRRGSSSVPVVSLGTYAQATALMALLKENGVESNITEGGISLHITIEEEFVAAHKTLASEGKIIELGDTFAAIFRDELRHLHLEE